jgi:hypothetical protein
MTTEDQIDQLSRDMSLRFTGIKEYLLDFRGEVIQRLDGIDRRLDNMSNSILAIETRMPGLNSAVRGLESENNDLLKRVQALEAQVKQLLSAA